MAILAGVDEAGFGPVLGPLVVSATVFRVADRTAGACLWEELAGAVTKKRFARSPALPVADSKTLRVRSAGLVHLERGVLGMCRQLGFVPRTLREFLRKTAPGAAEQMDRYPWYAGADVALPRQADAKDVALRAAAVTEAMRRCRMRLEGVSAEPVLAWDFNRLVAATRNKSVALFGVTSKLIWSIFKKYADSGHVRIIVDRQGGRMRYLPALQRMFEGAAIRIVEESDCRSAYQVRHGRRQAEICFVTKGEEDSMPVALASMISKYVREQFMELLNRWWAGRIDALKPTAGYYVDGRRFIKDIGPALSADGIDRSLLIRSR